MHAQKVGKLLNNSRFYILVSSVLISIMIAAWLRLQIPSTQLFYIRTEQVYGLVAILFWYVALLISPISYVVGKQRIKGLLFARRAIGVSAAYFAVLHLAVAIWGQLGGVDQLVYLPSLFKWSLAAGGVAVAVLLMMAATSFDVVIRFMTFKRWKLLHRLGYIGGTLAVLHIWTVGTHIAYSGIQITAFIALVILAGLETFRFVTVTTKRYQDLQGRDYFLTLFFSIWVAWIALILLIPVIVKNYHSQRHNEKVTISRTMHD